MTIFLIYELQSLTCFFSDKEDKKLETLKKLQQIEEQKEREVEMKELALKLRKRFVPVLNALITLKEKENI